MANGYPCEKCGYQETDHEMAWKRLYRDPSEKPLTGEEIRSIKEEAQVEFPGICSNYRNHNPKSWLATES